MFKGFLIARVYGSRAEAGAHELKIRCVNEDGGPVAPDTTAMFHVPEKGGAAHLIIEMSLTLPKIGRYEFSITVDKHEMDSWPLEAKEYKAKEPPKEPSKG